MGFDEQTIDGVQVMSDEPFPGSPDDMMNTIAALRARVVKLEEALNWFLNDERFQVGVGGNPNVVKKMIEDARAALSQTPDAEKS